MWAIAPSPACFLRLFHRSNGLILWGSISKTEIFVFFSLKLRKLSKSFPRDILWLPGGAAEYWKPSRKLSSTIKKVPIRRHSQFPEWLTHHSSSTLLAQKSQPRSKTNSYRVKDTRSQISMLGSCLPSQIMIFLLTYFIISPITVTFSLCRGSYDAICLS